MKANVIFSKFFSQEKANAARKLLDQLHIEICNENEDENLPKMKIITKSINEIPFNGVLECLTLTPLCLQQIILMNMSSSDSQTKSDKNVIRSPFDLEKYGNFFYNLFLFNKRLSFGNISEEEKDRLSKKIIYMGGKVVSLDDKNINYILTEKQCEDPQNVPMILPSWIDSLFESSIEININRFRVDDIESISANGSPNISSSRHHILLSIPDKPKTSQGKSSIFKSKNANSQPVSSLKGRSKRITKSLSNKIDSRQMILNFEKSTKHEEPSQSKQIKSQSLALIASQPKKTPTTSQTKQKKTNKSIQLKNKDNVMKIDNFMKPCKEVHQSQLIVTVEGENIDHESGNINDNDYESDDDAINDEDKLYEKKLEKKVLRSINNNILRAHGKPIKSSDEEDQNGPLINTRNKSNSDNQKKSTKTSLKKKSIVPSIINEMTEDAVLSSDNEPDYSIKNVIKRNDSDKHDDADHFEKFNKSLIDFSSDFDSKSPNRVTIHSVGINEQLSQSDLVRNLTSFSQSSCEFGESQNSFLSSSVYYDSLPKVVLDSEGSQKSEMLGKDPLIDCWDTFQNGVDTNSQ